jgi:cytosine/adenosine deaminase-related metal-dependent hydrolase
MIVGPALIVTGGSEPRVIEHGGVRVVGAHIAQVGPANGIAAAFPDETLWPARGRVMLPGLVNTHAHLARHLARGLGLRGAAEWERYERALAPEDLYWSALAALVEGVRHGVTTVCDFHRSSGSLELSLLEAASAARKLGTRLATGYGAAETDRPAERKLAVEESLGLAGEIRRRREGRLRALLSVRAETLTGVERLLDEALASTGGGLPVQVELALDATPGERWGGTLPEACGVAPALWSHAESAPRRLLGEIQERGDALCAVGVSARSALEREWELAWGSDNGVNAPPRPEDAVWGGARPDDLHYRRLLIAGPRWASRHFGERLGEIAPGAPADLLLVDYQPATELSPRTLQAHLASGLLRAPVSGAMVAGEIVMDGGALVSVDEREVAARARECAARLWERLG